MAKNLNKRIGKHSSVDRDLKRSLKKLLRQTGVVKVVLGPFHNCRHNSTVGSLLFQADIDAGIKIKGFCGDGVRDLFVYVKPPERKDGVIAFLDKEFSS